MKAKTALFVSSLIMIAGIALTIVHTMDVFTYLIIALGVVFILPALINMVMISSTNPNKPEGKAIKTQRIFGLISSVGSIILGITMIGWSNLFVQFLPMIFGIILILGGSFHLFTMGLAFRPTRLPIWLYIMPLTLLAIGFSIIYIDKNTLTPQYIVLMSGIGFIIFALNAWIELWFVRKINRMSTKSNNDNTVIDVEVESL